MARPKGSTNKKKTEEVIEEVVIVNEEVEELETGDDEVKETRKNITEEVETDSEESIVDVVTENIAKAKKSGVKKSVKKVYDDEDMIPVASFMAGRTNYKNKEKPYDEYSWEKFGEIEEVRYGTLVQMKRKGGKAFKKMLYVLPEEVQKDLGLTKVYEKIGRLEDIVKILDKPLDESLRFIDDATKEVKDVVRQILMNKLERKESIDFFKVKALAERLDMELNLDISL